MTSTNSTCPVQIGDWVVVTYIRDGYRGPVDVALQVSDLHSQQSFRVGTSGPGWVSPGNTRPATDAEIAAATT